MAHETVVYGIIRSTLPPSGESANMAVIDALPAEDDWPALTRGMFCAPERATRRGCFRTHALHFGGSMRDLEFREIPGWVAKLEGVLSRLRWSRVTLHIEAEMDANYVVEWQTDERQAPDPARWQRTVHRAGEAIDGDWAAYYGNPSP